MDRIVSNSPRHTLGTGHYESWFQRANHPSRQDAFWIRYTIFSPADSPDRAVGELWAIYFTPGRVVAVKEVHPLSSCRFDPGLNVQISGATLVDGRLDGQAALGEHTIGWSLSYTGDDPPLLLLPPGLYDAPLPKAKALVGTPMAVFDGELVVDGDTIPIDGWIGSQNHNWGSKHTDQYAWGQVAGFTEAPNAFLELSTARIRIGPFTTPWMTPMVMRLDGEEHRLSGLPRAILSNHGRYDEDALVWSFRGRQGGFELEGEIRGDAENFVALPYDNPPGGTKICLNSKVARCVIDVRHQGVTRRLTSERAAFEILTDRRDHPIPLLQV